MPNFKQEILHSGPPYVSGTLHYGTIYNILLKDLWVRVQKFKNKKVLTQYGFDMHGMPIEHYVQKKFGILFSEAKKNPAKFITQCKNEGLKNRKAMDAQIHNLMLEGAFFQKKPYYTHTKTAKKFFYKNFYKLRKHVYEGLKVESFCLTCDTFLSKREIENKKKNQEYFFILKPTNYAPFLIYTKSLWTIFNSDGIAYNKNLKYSLVQCEGVTFICSNRFLNKFPKKYDIIERNISFDHYELKPFHDHSITKQQYLLHDEFVKEDIGTGFVHLDAAHGHEDFQILSKIKPVTDIQTSDIYLTWLEKFLKQKCETFYQLNAKSESLLKNLLFYKIMEEKEVECCWRCNNPLIEALAYQLFLKTSSLDKEKLNTEIKKRKWAPLFSATNFFNFIGQLREWCLSRNRLFGIKMPYLKCTQCGYIMLGPQTKEFLFSNKYSAGPCPRCNTPLTQAPFVFDVWRESGALFNKYSKKYTIIEAHDQIRGWFYSLSIFGLLIKQTLPFKNVFVHGWVMQDKTQKLSKSKLNEDISNFLLQPNRNDRLRDLFYSFEIGKDIIFPGEEVILKKFLKFKNIVLNVFSFRAEYNLFHYNGHSEKKLPLIENLFFNELLNIEHEIKKNDLPLVTTLKDKLFLFSQKIMPLLRNKLREPETREINRVYFSTILHKIYNLLTIFFPVFASELETKFQCTKLSTCEPTIIKDDNFFHDFFELLSKINFEREKNQLDRKYLLKAITIFGPTKFLKKIYDKQEWLNCEKIIIKKSTILDVLIDFTETKELKRKRAINLLHSQLQMERKIQNKDTFDILDCYLSKNIFKNEELAILAKKTRLSFTINKRRTKKGNEVKYKNITLKFVLK
jgi:isoleucyl-tRNA synthetase